MQRESMTGGFSGLTHLSSLSNLFPHANNLIMKTPLTHELCFSVLQLWASLPLGLGS